MTHPLYTPSTARSPRVISFEPLQRGADAAEAANRAAEDQLVSAAENRRDDQGGRIRPEARKVTTMPNLNPQDARTYNTAPTLWKYDPQTNTLWLKLTDASSNTARAADLQAKLSKIAASLLAGVCDSAAALTRPRFGLAHVVR
jgi:hypothetical protein